MDFISYHNGKRIIFKDKHISATTELGKIDAEVLKKAKHGDVVKTSKEKELLLLEPTFYDRYHSMKRGAQAINLKDCGLILAETLVGKESVCLDCGTGMGGLSCFLARYVKKVYSMDNREEHTKTSKKNAEALGLKNIEFMIHDIYEGIPKKKLDLITLDIRQPELVVQNAKKSLNIGGFIVGYCPQATQMLAFTEELNKNNFLIMRCEESIVREWKCEGQILRPQHVGLQHTGFLIIARKIDE